MSNYIARGTTGQVPLFSRSTGGLLKFDQWEIYGPNGFHTFVVQGDSGPDSYGFKVTEDGMITVPADPMVAVDGDYDAIYYHNYPNPDPQFSYHVDSLYKFTAVCMTAALQIAQLNTIPGPSSGQYTHRYTVRVVNQGGTAPFSYSGWATTVGTLADFSSDNSNCILEVTNTSQDFSGITGTVSCDADDSDGCTASGSIDVTDATPSTEGPQPTCSAKGAAPGSGGVLGASGGLGMMALPLTGARGVIGGGLGVTRGAVGGGLGMTRGAVGGGLGMTRGAVGGGLGATRGGFQVQGGPSGTIGRPGGFGNGGGSGITTFGSGNAGGGGATCSSCVCGSGTDVSSPGGDDGTPDGGTSERNTPNDNTPFSWCVQPTGNNVVASAGSNPAQDSTYGSAWVTMS